MSGLAAISTATVVHAAARQQWAHGQCQRVAALWRRQLVQAQAAMWANLPLARAVARRVMLRPRLRQKEETSQQSQHMAGGGNHGADPSGLLAAVQAFSTVDPFLRSLGLTGKGKGKSSWGGGAKEQPQRKQQEEAVDLQQRSRQSRRTRDPQPDKIVTLVGTKRQATVVRPDTGEEAAVVAVCATCHWPY